MGFFKSIGRVFKKVGKAVKSIAKQAWQGVRNPAGFTKELVKNPFGKIAQMAGLDVLFARSYDGANPEHGSTWTQDESDDAKAPERARMLSRQGMQGATPIMLLGQDVTDDELTKDSKLGGDER